jgi:hypothetical protein
MFRRYFIIALLGLGLIYISTKFPPEPNLLTAIGYIVGLGMFLVGTIVMRIIRLDETLKNRNKTMEWNSHENTSTDEK